MFNYNIHNASIYYQAMEYVSKRFKDAAKLEEINGFGLPLYYWMDQAQKNHVKIVDQEFIRIKLTDPLKSPLLSTVTTTGPLFSFTE